VFSGSTFANEQLEYIWNEQYVKGKPDASIPFQEAAYVTNPQFALAYKGEPVVVTGVNKQTGEMFTYKATVTGNVNEANQIEVKTAKGALVYIKKSNLQTTTTKPVNVRANFNQTNSVMITAVDRTSGEIAKFNSNGERDAQGDTQLNVFAPRENDTMKEVRKSLASGQPISHTLPIHTGARINSAPAYRKGKNSVYLTASVASIDTNIQTVEPVLEQPTQPTDAKIDIVKDYVREVFTQARKSGRSGYMKRVREKLTQVTDPTLSIGKKYVRVETDEDGNLVRVGIVTGTGKSFEYTFMSGYTGSGKTKSTATNFPTFIDESGKESGMMTPERLGYFFELTEGQPTTLEPEVTSNLSKDELDILSFDTSSIEGLEGATESLDQNTSKEIDDAGSCKIN
jgi:hypothetical protein